MSMWASSATNEPSSSSPSGLISASVMSYSRNSRASLATIGVSRFKALPLTPSEAISCLASHSENGARVEKWRRATWSGCSLGDLLDVDPAHVREQHHRALADPVPDHAGVVLVGDRGPRVDEHAARHVAADLEVEDVLGVAGRLLRRVGELDPAGLHPAAAEDLRLDHHRAADLLGDPAGLVGCLGEAVLGHGDAGLGDDRPRLVLEEAHRGAGG